MKPAGSPGPQLHKDGSNQVQIVLHACTILSHNTRCTECQHGQSCDAQGNVLLLLHFQTLLPARCFCTLAFVAR
jgi:hypothetical protein